MAYRKQFAQCSIHPSLTASLAALVMLASLAPPGRADVDDAYVAAMAKEHAGDKPVASPAAASPSSEKADGQEVVYGRLVGRELSGYLARPAGGSKGKPGVIVIHEWWGLNDNIRSMTRQLAAEGFTALAVDLYSGAEATTSANAKVLMQAAMQDARGLLENIRLAHSYLLAEGAVRTGSIGWCFGGALSFETALMLGDKLDAVVMYYGRPVTKLDRLRGLEAPLLGLFGGDDRSIPISQVGMLEAGLKTLGKQAQFKVYSGAGHAFANPSGSAYQAEPAEDAWGRTLAFFREHLAR